VAIVSKRRVRADARASAVIDLVNRPESEGARASLRDAAEMDRRGGILRSTKRANAHAEKTLEEFAADPKSATAQLHALLVVDFDNRVSPRLKETARLNIDHHNLYFASYREAREKSAAAADDTTIIQ
jgi:hypothetical protein